MADLKRQEMLSKQRAKAREELSREQLKLRENYETYAPHHHQMADAFKRAGF